MRGFLFGLVLGAVGAVAGLHYLDLAHINQIHDMLGLDPVAVEEEVEVIIEDASDEDAGMVEEDAMDEDAMDDEAMDEDAMDEDAMDDDTMEDAEEGETP